MIKTLLLPILLIGSAVAGVFMYTLPEIEALSQKRSEKATYQNALNQAREILELKQELMVQYETFSPEDRLKLQKLLPDNSDTIGAIIETNTVAGENGVVLTSVADNPVARDESASANRVSTVSTTYDLTADYASFVTFLKAIERSLRITDVSSLTFDTEADEESSGSLLNFSLDADTYWLSE